jgi:hypothetical protein
MSRDDESMAKRFMKDFERGASYQELMAKYHLTQQEIEILVEGLYPSTLSQQITLVDWRAQTQEDASQLKEHSDPPKKSSILDFFRRRSPREKTSPGVFKKLFSKRK